ncbi:hypothetical protein FVEN_g413 [Fusarium venenatum]|uniref:Uncharacterized protein n=1 Tax=Fusarium venenatum TaxID=56646 RepID=A0A2L2TQF2_9HYPO|nr:uncharacterized protein FVRRES_07466 [Fusarium venenatum]KAG8361962.1 hypothetical protein FVEN_g413 [Fusarium venenatum]KAH6994382.1 hypothetical protein EDB82DRAFT_501589 [Fusarium venenatum]CEI63030.1 unnamed protein product [Fusarium venenatum]
MELITFLLRVTAFTLFAVIPTVHATYYDIPYNMTAGETFNVTIKQNIDPNSENGRATDSYRVYLALTPPGWGTGPVCWLQYLVPRDQTQVNITIPPDVAPKGTRIRLSTCLTNSKNGRRVTGFDYSGRTDMSGLNGTWSQAELDGRSTGDQDEVSCSAYGCVRDCYDLYYKGDKDDEEYSRKSYACWKACARDLNPASAASLNVTPVKSLLGVGVMVGFLHLIVGAL